MVEEELITVFEREFGTLKHLFEVFSFRMSEINGQPLKDEWARPGVYVFLKNEEVMKVGKHQVNSFKRSQEHVRDNTASKDGRIQMKEFEGDMNVEVILFNVKSKDFIHWILALEFFFEKSLSLAIPSHRLG